MALGLCGLRSGLPLVFFGAICDFARGWEGKLGCAGCLLDSRTFCEQSCGRGELPLGLCSFFCLSCAREFIIRGSACEISLFFTIWVAQFWVLGVDALFLLGLRVG